MVSKLKTKNYTGKKCIKCGVPVSIGSKSGYCKKDTPRKRHTDASKHKISLAKVGNKNPQYGKSLCPATRHKISQALVGNKNSLGRRPWNKGVQYTKIRGNNHWNWKGGKTSENKTGRRRVEYKNWRISVFERDDYTCQSCHKRGVHLHAHHIKPYAHFPELRYCLSNGVTLCVACHCDADPEAKKFYETNQRSEGNS